MMIFQLVKVKMALPEMALPGLFYNKFEKKNSNRNIRVGSSK